MTNFDKNALKELERLCRIKCTPQEEEELLKNLRKMIDFIQQLNEVNTDNVPKGQHILKDIQKNLMRDDEVGDSLSRDAFLSNAPSQISGMIRVPPIMKSNE